MSHILNNNNNVFIFFKLLQIIEHKGTFLICIAYYAVIGYGYLLMNPFSNKILFKGRRGGHEADWCFSIQCEDRFVKRLLEVIVVWHPCFLLFFTGLCVVDTVHFACLQENAESWYCKALLTFSCNLVTDVPNYSFWWDRRLQLIGGIWKFNRFRSSFFFL